MAEIGRFIRKVKRYIIDPKYRTKIRYRCEIASLSKRIARRPNDPGLHFDRALSFYFLNLYARAIEDYTRVLEMLPEHGRRFPFPVDFVLVQRACAYREHKLWDEAIRDFEKAYELNPDEDIYRSRAMCFEGMWETTGNKDMLLRAIEDYDKACELDPGNGALCGKSMALEKLEDFAGALATATRAIERGGDDTGLAYMIRGDIHEKLGDLDAAIADSDKALQLNLRKCLDLEATAQPPFVDLDMHTEPKRSEIADWLARHHTHRAVLWEKLGNIEQAEEDKLRACEYEARVVVKPR